MKRRMVTLPTNKRSKSQFVVMEILHIGNLKEHMTRGRKVSCCWICINVKKIQYDLDVKNGTRLSTWFKASSGWFHKFLKRNHIKFRKRKSGKKNSTDDNLDKILRFYSYMRHDILLRWEGDDLDH